MILLLSVLSCLKADADTLAKTVLKAYPSIYYTPETRVAVGSIGYASFRVNQSDTLSRRCNVQLYLSYTQNKQYGVEADALLFGKAERYMHNFSFDYTRFPEFFYGIGNETSSADRELYTFDRVKVYGRSVRQISNKWFLGGFLQSEQLFNVEVNQSGAMFTKHVPGVDGYWVAGGGASLLKDTRDNPLNATRGFYMEWQQGYYPAFTEENFRYYHQSFNLRGFVPISFGKDRRWFKQLIWASELQADFSAGDLPFRTLPPLGGPHFMRGYYLGRFRDKNRLVAQTEGRLHIYKRLGFAAFGGLGQVASYLDEFMHDGFKYHYGAGLRFQISRKDKVNLRFDYGRTAESHGFYILFAEAF